DVSIITRVFQFRTSTESSQRGFVVRIPRHRRNHDDRHAGLRQNPQLRHRAAEVMDKRWLASLLSVSPRCSAGPIERWEELDVINNQYELVWPEFGDRLKKAERKREIQRIVRRGTKDDRPIHHAAGGFGESIVAARQFVFRPADPFRRFLVDVGAETKHL